MKRFLRVFLSIFMGIGSLVLLYSYCIISKQEFNTFGYNLSEPEKRFVLPTVLNEISGITTINKTQIACVQDEIGTIYIYDLAKASIVKEYTSEVKGDFEEIALVDSTMYLLRSDGVIIEQTHYSEKSAKRKEYNLDLPSDNNEGLCYDKKNNRLLIAAKSKAGKGYKNNEFRLIYSFDLNDKTARPKQIFKLKIEEIEAKAVSLNIAIPYKTIKKTGEQISDFYFRPSAISIHPFDHLIYILSSKDKLLLIMDDNGIIKNLIALDPVLFNKAEGITFLPNGDMLISNEAQKGKPTLLKFKYHKRKQVE